MEGKTGGRRRGGFREVGAVWRYGAEGKNQSRWSGGEGSESKDILGFGGLNL